MNYLFYLEPYAFLLRSNDKTVVAEFNLQMQQNSD